MSDNTGLVAEARKYRTKHATPCPANGVEHDCTHEYLNGFPAELLDALADALEAAEAAIQNASARVLTLRIERDEARRIALQYRDSCVRAVEGMRGIPLPTGKFKRHVEWTHASWCMSRKGCNCAPTQPKGNTDPKENNRG